MAPSQLQDKQNKAGGDVVKYLSQKYAGDSFKITGLIEECGGMPSDIWYVEESGVDKQFLVYGFSTENGYELLDNRPKVPQSYPSVNSSPKGSVYAQKPLSPWQLERLCNIVYFDPLLAYRNYGQLGAILATIRDYDFPEDKTLACYMSKDEWMDILNSVIEDEALSALTIALCEDTGNSRDYVLAGQRAICFQAENNDAYIIYRGTYGDAEWYDNGVAMIESDSIQQKAALRFLERCRAVTGAGRIYVAGHSKGGNKAQYVAIVSPEPVDFCLSIDGQGFSTAFFQKYADSIASRKDNIMLIAEQRDFVNSLGQYVADTTYYRGWRGDHTPTQPYGAPLPFFHCPDALRSVENGIAAGCSDAAIPSLVNDLIAFFLTDSEYEEGRDEIVSAIVSLLMHTPTRTNRQMAKAVAKLSVVFLDRYTKCEALDEKLENLLLLEPEALLATVSPGFDPPKIGNRTGDDDDFTECVLQELASSILMNFKNLRNFLYTLRKLRRTLRKLKSDYPLLKTYIVVFIIELVRRLFSQKESLGIQISEGMRSSAYVKIALKRQLAQYRKLDR